MTREVTLTSSGRWFGWHWELPVVRTVDGMRLAASYTGYALTRRGALRAAAACARQEQRRHTEQVQL
jgi:hypothetical protein